AVLLQELEFVVAQRAASRVTCQMFYKAERDLIHAIFDQMRFQLLQAVDLGPIWQPSSGVDVHTAFEQTGGIILFKRQSPGINPCMTIRATGLAAMLFNLLTQC